MLHRAQPRPVILPQYCPITCMLYRPVLLHSSCTGPISFHYLHTVHDPTSSCYMPDKKWNIRQEKRTFWPFYSVCPPCLMTIPLCVSTLPDGHSTLCVPCLIFHSVFTSSDGHSTLCSPSLMTIPVCVSSLSYGRSTPCSPCLMAIPLSVHLS